MTNRSVLLLTLLAFGSGLAPGQAKTGRQRITWLL